MPLQYHKKKYSKLRASDDPAIAFSPNELIPLWINTFDTEKITPWIPASATQLPTAASAFDPANLPTTATSAELNNCCKILLNANGIANSNSH